MESNPHWVRVQWSEKCVQSCSECLQCQIKYSNAQGEIDFQVQKC